jgi:hypothetical protein
LTFDGGPPLSTEERILRKIVTATTIIPSTFVDAASSSLSKDVVWIASSLFPGYHRNLL